MAGIQSQTDSRSNSRFWRPTIALLMLLCIVTTAGQTSLDPVGCAIPPSGLMAWWAGEDNALDTTGAFHGVAQNGVGHAPGHVARAFDFDGIDDSVLVGMMGSVGVAETAPFTIIAWENSDNVSAQLAQVIAGNYMGEGGDIGNFSLFLLISDGQIHFGINKRQINAVSVSTAVSSGWQFVTATYDGSELKLYVNAELRSSGVRPFSGATNNTRGWNVGNYSDATNAAHGFNSTFNGLLDEVAVFDRALNASEISAIYATSNLGMCRPTIFANGFE